MLINKSRKSIIFAIFGVYFGAYGTLTSAVAQPISPEDLALDAGARYPENHGPRAGYVRSAAELTTEIVARDPKKVEVYLLDSRWVDVPNKNYTVTYRIVTTKSESGAKRSTAKGAAKSGDKWTPCLMQADGFICELTSDLKKGDTFSLAVSSNPPTAKAPTEIDYQYPFTYTDESKSESKKQ